MIALKIALALNVIATLMNVVSCYKQNSITRIMYEIVKLQGKRIDNLEDKLRKCERKHDGRNI